MAGAELVAQICRDATTRRSGAVVDVVTDPLDGSVWVRMASWPRVQEAIAGLQAHGLNTVERPDCRLQVRGWDARLLRRRLGTALAGVDDLREEWEATAELVRYHYDKRVWTGEGPDPGNVLGDVEQAMREARPIPHRAPATEDIETLLQLVEAAEDAYEQLIAEHLEYAEQIIEACQRGDRSAPAP